MAKTYIQVRTDENDKEMASKILDKLGTNLSAVSANGKCTKNANINCTTLQ